MTSKQAIQKALEYNQLARRYIGLGSPITARIAIEKAIELEQLSQEIEINERQKRERDAVSEEVGDL